MPKMVDLYYFPKGAEKVERVSTFEIDANEAVAKWPEDYSLTPPKTRKEVVDLTPALPTTDAELQKMAAPVAPDDKKSDPLNAPAPAPTA